MKKQQPKITLANRPFKSREQRDNHLLKIAKKQEREKKAKGKQ